MDVNGSGIVDLHDLVPRKRSAHPWDKCEVGHGFEIANRAVVNQRNTVETEGVRWASRAHEGKLYAVRVK